MFRVNSVCATAIKAILVAVFVLFALHAYADEDYLQPDVAFKFSARMAGAKTVEVKYMIADGYYMYRERFAFKAEGATLGVPRFPAGKVKFDETFQKNVETFRKTVTIMLPADAGAPFTLTVTGQGCADKGLCYAPMESTVKLTPKSGGVAGTIATDQPGSDSAAPDSDMGRIEASLKSGKLSVVFPLFLLLGLGLAFTPCVLPMVPILSFIIVGEGARVSRTRGLALSSTYALGMALIYTGLGIAAGLAGEGLSAALQNPWILTAFALLMAVLSLSMFGVYQLQVPAAIQMKLTRASEKQAAGKLVGVFVMGALSALIVGPCVAAPLAGALIYISQTRDVVLGGSALFAMAVGMSLPLLAVGVSAGSLLPRAGVWMEQVKHFFGVLMLAMAWWIIAPVIPAVAQMLGWAVLLAAYGVYLLRPKRAGRLSIVFGVLFIVGGIVQLAGVATGARDVLAPLAGFSATYVKKPEFVRVKSIAELDAALAQAKGKTVLLDFYADWCVSCKEMEKFTFSDPGIQTQLSNMLLLQADVTANNSDDKNLLKRFQLFGPPGIIFFAKQGDEIAGGRVIGYQDAAKFAQSLTMVTQL